MNAGPSTAIPARAGPQKRSLEDLMNGGDVNGTLTSTGFGSSTGTSSTGFGISAGGGGQTLGQRTANAPWPPAAAVSKRPKTEFAEKSTNSNDAEQPPAATNVPAAKPALPAFLLPANVSAAYGAQPATSKD